MIEESSQIPRDTNAPRSLRVLIVEEYPARERLALLCLGHVLRERGHAVAITHVLGIERTFRRFKPDVVVDNISDSVYHFMGKLGFMDARHRNVNLCWEQLVNPMNLYRYRFDDSVVDRLVDGRVSWGPNFRDVLLAQNPEMDPSRICETGSMKMVVQKMFGEIDPQMLRRHYGVQDGGRERTVLVAESFQLTEYTPGEIKRRFRATAAAPFLYEYLAYAARMQDRYIEKVRDLATALPDVHFLLRVHPGKNPDYYRRYRERLKLDNVQITRQGDVGGLLRVSDLLLASRSGTLVDAHAQGVPALNLLDRDDPLQRTHVFDAVENEFGIATDLSSLDAGMVLAAIQDCSPEPAPAAVADALEGWFGPLDRGVFTRVARWIEEVVERPALTKRPRLDEVMYPSVLRRITGNRLRRWGLWRRGEERPVEEEWYRTLFHEMRPLIDGA